MHRFFADQCEDEVFLKPEDAVHAIRVLRLGEGDLIEVILDAKRWKARVSLAEQGKVRADLLEQLPDTEASIKVTLFQGMPKADKMELIVQKCTELGVSRIVPVFMERSVVSNENAKALERKTERWSKIAQEAVKQCGRTQPLAVEKADLLERQMDRLKALDLLIVPWEKASGKGTASLRERIEAGKQTIQGKRLSVGIVIGPEGGISEQEIEWLKDKAGAHTVTLGPRILRTETAAIVASALVLAYAGELD